MRTVIAALVCIGASIGLLAHHDISQTFDESRTVEVRGVVTKVFWGNPHPTIEIRQTGQDGGTITWLLEAQAIPNELERRGWTRTSITIGEAILARGYPARQPSATQASATQSSTMVLVQVARADGSQLDASSATRWQTAR